MSTTTLSTGQPEPASSATPAAHLASDPLPAHKQEETMGVASLATKRHLESPIDGDEVVSAKIAKLNNNNNSINQNLVVTAQATVEHISGDGSSGVEGEIVHSQIFATSQEAQSQNGDSSTELVTTSILARTLLTTSSNGAVGPSGGGILNGIINHHNQYSSSGAQDPLESLKSSLEALPAPAILDHSPGYNSKTIGSHHTSATDPLVGFASLLGPDRHLVSAATVLSPIDEVDPIEWNNPAKATPVVNGVAAPVEHLNHGINPSISSLTTLVDHQLLNGTGSHHHCPSSPHHEVITEDENGKSYFNLGAAQDSTILARKSSGSSSSSISSGDLGAPGWVGGSCQGQNNNSGDFDDAISSSSCDSISSEDLFNSGEEFDASDDDEDEDELCTYKQQRSTVLHLSLCKLNKFRTNCVEPSLHRSVLICNTLRHIEQEIRNEDEAASEDNLKSRERLPSFWPAPPANTGNPPGNPNPPNNCFPLSPGAGAQGSPSQPQITDTRPMVPGVLPLQPNGLGGLPSMGQPPMLPPTTGAPNGGHDPYLTPNPYNEAPYLSAYDYNSPRPTPFHTTSYDYEQDLLLPPPPNASPSSTTPSQASTGQSSGVSSILGLSDVTSAGSSLLECDSGYSDADLDMSLSSYYYTSPLPPPPVVPPVTTSHHPVQPPSQPEFTSLGASVVSSSPSSVVVTSSSLISPGAIIPISSSGSVASSSCISSSSSTSSNPYHLPHHPGFQPLPPAADLLSGPSPPCPQPVVPMEISELACSGDICEITSSSANTSPPPSTTTSASSVSSSGASCDYSLASSSSSSCSSSTATTLTNSISGCESSSASLVVDAGTSSEATSTTSPSNSPPHYTSPPHSPPSSAAIVSTTACGGLPATSTVSTSLTSNTFAQQDSQCGLESRRSDLSRNVGNHYNNHHSLPMMDSLISPAYSSSSL